MKRFYLIIAVMMTVVLSSCIKEEMPDKVVKDTATIKVNFSSPQFTRAFFEETHIAEPWEKEIKTLSVSVYNKNWDFIYRKDFDQTEIANLSAELELPFDLANGKCTVMAVANYSLGSAVTYSELRDLQENYMSLYNGSFDQVTTGYCRPEGFIMTASEEVTIKSNNSTTDLSLVLKRTVAKVAIKTVVDPMATQRYGGGTIEVISMNITNTANYSYIFVPGKKWEFSTGTPSQAPSWDGEAYCNLFYIYENPVRSWRPTLVINAVYDRDGDPETTGDRVRYTLEIPLELSGDGEADRNAYYRIFLDIKGLGQAEVRSLVSSAEWETPKTENITYDSN